MRLTALALLAVAGLVLAPYVTGGLLLLGLSVSEQMIARGIVIILAVSLSLREKRED